MEDLLRQNYYAAKLGANYLTQREIDLEIINQCEGRTSPILRTVSPTVFSHSLPVVDELPIKKLLKLRKSEGAAFTPYREALTKALKEHPKLQLREQIQLFDDVVKPEIAKIEFAVRKARKLLVKSLIQDSVVACGAVGIGLFSGLLPHDIGVAATGLGGLHYSPKFVKKLTELCTEPQQAMDSRYYFLWKAKHLRHGASQRKAR